MNEREIKVIVCVRPQATAFEFLWPVGGKTAQLPFSCTVPPLQMELVFVNLNED